VPKSVKVPVKTADVLVVIIGLVILAIVGDLCWSVESSQSAKAAAIDMQTARLDATIAHEHLVERSLPAWERHAQDYATLIPVTDQFANLVQDISHAAAQAGVTWAYGAPITATAPGVASSTTPATAGAQLASPAPTGPGAQGHALTLGVDGTLAHIGAFIRALQSMPRLVFINGITFLTHPYGLQGPLPTNIGALASPANVQGATIEVTYYSR